MDFKNLNKACPKDKFPLPNIDLLIDSATRSAMFSFMDGFSEYNQIRMAQKDANKTAFRTPMSNFYYTMMPFGLKKRGCNLSMSDDSHISRYDALGIRGLCGQHSG